MSILQNVRKGWRRFLYELAPHDREKLLAWLQGCYRDETADEAQFSRHAKWMYYPQFQKRMQQIATEEQAQVQWLREQILALGGRLPAVSRTFKAGDNNWQNLLLDLDEEKQSCTALLEGIRLAERVDNNIAIGLQRIRNEELRHQEEIRDMLAKSEPGAVRVPDPADEETARRKEEWLGEQKAAWLEQQRAMWEASGKQTPWAEWEREQEFKWNAELPQYELRWARLIERNKAGENTDELLAPS